jgi:hypothetical protein
MACKKRRDMKGLGIVLGLGISRKGKEMQGMARQGRVWKGKANKGMARHGMGWYDKTRHGNARQGNAR